MNAVACVRSVIKTLDIVQAVSAKIIEFCKMVHVFAR